MRPQLRDDEFAKLLGESQPERVGSNDPEVQRFRQALQAIPDFAQVNSQRPEVFWTRQRAEVWKAIERGTAMQRRSIPKFGWVAAAAVVAIAALMLSVSPVPQAPQARVDPDHELLLDIERSLNSGGPQALEPASLLVEEISQNAQSNPASPVEIKERTQ
jgi:hypothetical protein